MLRGTGHSSRYPTLDDKSVSQSPLTAEIWARRSVFSVNNSDQPLTLSNIAHYAAGYGICIDPEAVCTVIFWPELVGDGDVVGLGAGHEDLERLLCWVGVEEAEREVNVSGSQPREERSTHVRQP